MKRDVLRVADLSREEIQAILDLAARLKAELRAGTPHPRLAGRKIGRAHV